MFDNLPFLPAIEMLGSVQRVYSRRHASPTPLQLLRQRHDCPDLFIAGSLNVRPEEDNEAKKPFDDLITIKNRAGALQDNVKIRDFQGIAGTVSQQLDLFFASSPDPARVDREFIDGIVDATVLPVFPVDSDHLNPTYAFCASTGMKAERVQKSIADGCFQTFAALAQAQSKSLKDGDDCKQASRSVTKLKEKGRIPEIRWARESGGEISGRGHCPFFRHSTDAEQSQIAAKLIPRQEGEISDFVCPFYAAEKPAGREIFKTCVGDPAHKKEEARHPSRGTTFQKATAAAYRVGRRFSSPRESSRDTAGQ